MELITGLVGSDELIAVMLAVIGGTGSFLQACRTGDLKGSLFNFVTEIVLSVTTGLAVLYLGSWQDWKPALTNSLILILANNGGDTLATAKSLLARALKNKLNLGDKQNG